MVSLEHLGPEKGTKHGLIGIRLEAVYGAAPSYALPKVLINLQLFLNAHPLDPNVQDIDQAAGCQAYSGYSREVAFPLFASRQIGKGGAGHVLRRHVRIVHDEVRLEREFALDNLFVVVLPEEVSNQPDALEGLSLLSLALGVHVVGPDILPITVLDAQFHRGPPRVARPDRSQAVLV